MPNSEQETWTFTVVIGVACLLVVVSCIGFFYLRKRNKCETKQVLKKEAVVDAAPPLDNLQNCRVYQTNHGLRVYRCDEKTGQPLTKVDI